MIGLPGSVRSADIGALTTNMTRVTLDYTQNFLYGPHETTCSTW
jgi:hypothetical protein